jgi:multidrug efflux system membrane fusion protein
MNDRSLFSCGCACLTLLVVLTGCGGGPQAAAPGPLAVPVSEPVSRLVTNYVYYTGRTNAVEALNVTARVSGYIVKMPFQEGAEVTAGDVLFELDPRPYQAQYNLAKAQVALSKAQLIFTEKTFQRDMELIKKKSISQQEYDQDKALLDQAAAQVEAYQASLEVYKLNLEFTKVTSPIDGQVSRYYLTLGNLAVQDQTLLSTVVSLDPMYVYFDMDQLTSTKIKQAIEAGKIKSPAPPFPPAAAAAQTVGWMGSPLDQSAFVGAFCLEPPNSVKKIAPVFMGLEGEVGFPHKGTIDFVNNQFNPSTGTIAVRGVFPNLKLKNGVRLLSPGMFTRVQLPLGAPHSALLVIDRAIGSDQGLKYVYVVDSANKVEYRRVTLGPLQKDGLRVVEDGLQPHDRVIVGALQQVHPQMVVDPQMMPMPTLGAMK